MRRAAKVDDNQKSITSALRIAGATVQHISMIGKGCPDLLVGFRGVNYLLEVKDGSKPLSGRRLTPDELAWHKEWRGWVAVVECSVDALRAIGAIA